MMLANKPKIAYLSSNDPTNKRVWSGTHYSIYASLQKHVGDVTVLGPYEPKFILLISKVLTGLSQLILKKRYNYPHSYLLAKAYGRFFNKKLKQHHFDIIVAPAASCELAYIQTQIPIIYISDATISLSINYHKALTGLLSFSETETREIEKRALRNSTHIIVSSSWAANSLITDSHVSKEKITVLPFGANMELLPGKKDLETKLSTHTCKLLFIGVYWESKGGEFAYNCLVELLKMGIDAELTICGCQPPEMFSNPKIKVIPFIDKNSKEGMQKLYEIFFQHDFLILPTRFDCTPIVICEASAFGIPSLVANTGGVSGHLLPEENGFLIDFEDIGIGYAKKIADVFTDKERFNLLKASSRATFESKLNWDVYGKALKKIIDSILCNG